MFFLGVDLRILPVGEHYRPAHDLMPEAATQPVDGAFQPLGFDALRLVTQKVELYGRIVRGQRRAAQPHASVGKIQRESPVKKPHGRLRNFSGQAGGPRQRLLAALDEVISEKLNPAHHIDAVESKLFGIGAESYTVGSNEFYMGYATSRQTALCLDAGHFHPTEVISDKISAAMLYVPQLLLHVSRPVRWDSDHVVLLDDETQAIASEIVRHDLFDRVHIGLDFFDASINRIAAWVIGTRNMKKALLRALLEPTAELRKLEAAGDYTARLALLEEQKSLPWQAVWEMYCQRHDTPAGSEWLESVRAYEKEILSRRG